MFAPPPDKVLALSNIAIAKSPTDPSFFEKEIIVGVCMSNNATTLQRCLQSIIIQDIFFEKIALVLLDDSSTDGWKKEIADLLSLPNLVVLNGNCGTPARARNSILDFVDQCFDHGKWIARLDADDCLSNTTSLSTLCNYGDTNKVSYVLAGNRLTINGKLIEKVNLASRQLREPNSLLELLMQMAENSAYNELPSCNLLLATRTGWRYPDVKSAEDHWLVSDLLINHPEKGVILEDFVYCDYSLNGSMTHQNSSSGKHQLTRQKLYYAAKSWVKQYQNTDTRLLGYGMEGIVCAQDTLIKKTFYPGIIGKDKVQWLEKTFTDEDFFVPKTEWQENGQQWVCHYEAFESTEANTITSAQAKQFLLCCLEKKVVCINIKRSNFRIDSVGNLVYIDIGSSIMPMDISYFLDSAARLYGISILGMGDYELLRRNNKAREKQEEILNRMEGFTGFYQELLSTYSSSHWQESSIKAIYSPLPSVDCSLMIKACAMNHQYLTSQVKHIVSSLQHPRSFKERILLIDPHTGPFLRQYDEPNMDLLFEQANQLLEDGFIERIIIAPKEKEEIRAINSRWFGLQCEQTHSIKGAPITPQVWGFDQVKTRYVLQCDIDVLIGRYSLSHDYLPEMMLASEADDITGVAFNIPHDVEQGFRQYDAPAGDYVPEVRCGLLDLLRIKSLLPLQNTINEGKLSLSWFRSLQQYQQKTGMRTLRGGSPLTYYIHPQNGWKRDSKKLAKVRDLVSQGWIPEFQLEKWDLEGIPEQWEYEKRTEKIVFLLKGRNTPILKLQRCFASLMMQEDQDFGMIVIDDASTADHQVLLPSLLGSLMKKTTLIRNEIHRGRIPNFITAIKEICTDGESLIAILDLDDALMNKKITCTLKTLLSQGHDLIQGGMFRPNKPLKIYTQDYENHKLKRGGNVWSHLRTFKKSLFDVIPEEHFKIDEEWMEECTDYATMIPLVERSKKPIFIPEYWYYHENTTPRTPQSIAKKNQIIFQILKK